MVKVKGMKEIHSQWRQREVTWEEYRDAVWLIRVRKAKVQLQMNLVRGAKSNKKGIYRYIN